jgi:hypothetical protein
MEEKGQKRTIYVFTTRRIIMLGHCRLCQPTVFWFRVVREQQELRICPKYIPSGWINIENGGSMICILGGPLVKCERVSLSYFGEPAFALAVLIASYWLRHVYVFGASAP